MRYTQSKMSVQAKKIQESIQKARKAAQELQQQIKTQFDSLDDMKSFNFLQFYFC